MNENPYKYKGPLDPAVDSKSNICRPRAKEVNTVIEGITRGDYWAVLGPKQIGKTTFLRLIQNQLPIDYPIYFNLQISPSNENNFYQALIDKLLEKIPHARKPKISKKIRNYKPELRFLDFLKKFKPENTAGKIVLLFDEIDRLPFLKEFLFLWRRVYHERYHEESLNKYIIIVTGSVNLIELTIDETSPFNVAETLYLKDFSKEEAKTLVMEPLNRLNIKIRNKAKEKLLAQTAGHPQLLQHACHILVESTSASNKAITERNVIQAIEKLIVDNSNLDTLRRDLSRDNELKNLARDILNGEKRVFHPYKKFSLMGAGAIITKALNCDIRNEIYRRVISDVLKKDSVIESNEKETEKAEETKSIHPQSPPPKKVFISYSHHDARWKEKLETHLGILENKGILVAWNDQKIDPGDNWFEIIKKEVNSANIVIFLVSAYSLTSEFILREEIPDFLEKRQKEGMVVFPVIVSDCPWEHVDWLKKLQVWPPNAKPLEEFRLAKQNKILANVARKIAELAT